jgi:anti-sigma factor RsiW
MNHVHEGALQAWLDGELTASERSGLAEHLQGCGACRDRAAELRAAAERLSAALALVDTPPPARVAPARRRAFAAPFAGGLVRAAGLALLLAGGAAALIPGSPFRDFIADAWRNLASPAETDLVEAPVEPAQEEQEELAGSRLAVRPVDGVVRVNLVAPNADARIRVSFGDEAQAEISVERTGPDYELTGGRGWIDVEGIQAGLVTVRIPRTVGAATVEVDGRVVVRKEGDRLVRVPAGTDGPAVEVAPGG